MKRFFFDRTDGHVDEDQEGVELPSMEAARAEAIIFAGALVNDNPDLLAYGQDLRVNVTDANHVVLFSVIVSTSDAFVVSDER